MDGWIDIIIHNRHPRGKILMHLHCRLVMEEARRWSTYQTLAVRIRNEGEKALRKYYFRSKYLGTEETLTPETPEEREPIETDIHFIFLPLSQKI